jgi:hypothetical protein
MFGAMDNSFDGVQDLWGWGWDEFPLFNLSWSLHILPPLSSFLSYPLFPSPHFLTFILFAILNIYNMNFHIYTC